MSATSSSARIEAARQALARWDGGSLTAAPSLAEALRALIEPPATVETPEQIAEAWRENLYRNGTIEALGAGQGKPWHGLYAEAYRQGIHAGIQAAWESWEPETANIDDEEDI